MGEEADVRVPGIDEATTGSSLQGRLRSALLTRGWNRGPEPRVRFGQPLLPGLACLGRRRPRRRRARCWRDADALRDGPPHACSAAITPVRRRDRLGRTRSHARRWRVALHGLEHLVPGRVRRGPRRVARRAREWWALVATHLQDWLTRGRRGHGAAARLEAQTRRVTNLIQLATIFAGRAAGRPRPSSGAPGGGLHRRDVARRHAAAPSRRRLAGRRRARAASPPAASSTARRREAGSRPPRPSCGASCASWCTTTAGCATAARRARRWSSPSTSSCSPSLWANVEEIPAWERKRVRVMTYCLARLLHPERRARAG